MAYYNSSLLRIMWSLVDSHAQFLRGLTDEAIASWLLRAIEDQVYIHPAEAEVVQAYIVQRKCLIRDLIETQPPILSLAIEPPAHPTPITLAPRCAEA
ncbi:hypothetical protein IQ266_18690 [filamentous cyanobacterium LEGE 11480]|uniref:Uncharacterized protein n=1 Tax=Romeriopsis navalis LEGE 11480 TaxID=2777977 RepID=A0A928VSJ7_9CYAN|nr:hypothetical protein [Romeriopsis navalis]MBE9031765.1 hypothetical protein [Romeriopsis navalis LEGE 11480]